LRGTVLKCAAQEIPQIDPPEAEKKASYLFKDGNSLLAKRESSSGRPRRPCQDAHEKPRLPHPVAEVELSNLPEEEPQAKEESKRST